MMKLTIAPFPRRLDQVSKGDLYTNGMGGDHLYLGLGDGDALQLISDGAIKPSISAARPVAGTTTFVDGLEIRPCGPLTEVHEPSSGDPANGHLVTFGTNKSGIFVDDGHDLIVVELWTGQRHRFEQIKPVRAFSRWSLWRIRGEEEGMIAKLGADHTMQNAV